MQRGCAQLENEVSPLKWALPATDLSESRQKAGAKRETIIERKLAVWVRWEWDVHLCTLKRAPAKDRRRAKVKSFISQEKHRGQRQTDALLKQSCCVRRNEFIQRRWTSACGVTHEFTPEERGRKNKRERERKNWVRNECCLTASLEWKDA